VEVSEKRVAKITGENARFFSGSVFVKWGSSKLTSNGAFRRLTDDVGKEIMSAYARSYGAIVSVAEVTGGALLMGTGAGAAPGAYFVARGLEAVASNVTGQTRGSTQAVRYLFGDDIAKTYDNTMIFLDATVGLKALHDIHTNESKLPQESTEGFFAKIASKLNEVNNVVRPGLMNRTDAEFVRMGQLIETEFDALVEISKKHDVKFGIAGGLAETRIGIARRLDPNARGDLVPPWRRPGGTPKGRDVDLWFEEGTPLQKRQQVTDDVKKLFPDCPEIDAKYSEFYQPETNLKKAGAIVFDKGAIRRYLAPWQK
jgi:hypothetical protein